MLHVVAVVVEVVVVAVEAIVVALVVVLVVVVSGSGKSRGSATNVATCLSVIVRNMCSRTDAVGVILGASLRAHWSWGRSRSRGNSYRTCWPSSTVRKQPTMLLNQALL